MAENEELMQEVQETTENTKEVSCNRRKGCITHKLFGLKGLSFIWKVLSVIALLYMIYILVMYWYYVIKQGAEVPLEESLVITLQIFVTYGLSALVFITFSRICKVLKKIKHAVEHK